MKKYTKSLRRCLLLLCLLSGFTAIADSHVAPVFVRYGQPATDADALGDNMRHHAVQNMYDNYGLIGGWLAESAMRDAEDGLDRSTQLFLDALPNLTAILEDGIDNGWRCFGIPDGQDCRPLVILHSRGSSGDDIALESVPGRPIDAVSVEIHLSFEVVQATIDYLTWSDKRDKVGRVEQLRIWYYRTPDEVPPDGIDSKMPPEARLRPIFAPEPEKLSADQQAMLPKHRAFWIDSDPSPIELLVRDFVRDFPEVLDHLYSTNAFDGESPRLGKWYRSLESVKSLAKKHGESCGFDYCKNRLIRLGKGTEHHVIIRKYGPDYIVRVVPCSDLWCTVSEH